MPFESFPQSGDLKNPDNQETLNRASEEESREALVQVSPIEDDEQKLQSRRKFLKSLGAGAVAAVLGGPTLRGYMQEAAFGEKLRESIAEKQQHIKAVYGVEAVFDGSNDINGYQSSELRLAQQERGISLVLEELDALPPLLLKNSPLEKIFLRSDLGHVEDSRKDELLPMLHTYGGTVIGYRSEHRTMTLNVGGNLADGFHLFGWSEGEARESFAHEVFHAVENIDNKEWESLQQGEYRYASPERYSKFVEGAHIKISGFARAYGALNPMEDKATIYEALTDAGTYQDILKRSETDSVLAKKIKTIKEYMRKSSFGLMDEQYWIDLSAGKANMGHFRAKARRLISEDAKNYCAKNPDVTEGEFFQWQDRLREEYGKDL